MMSRSQLPKGMKKLLPHIGCNVASIYDAKYISHRISYIQGEVTFVYEEWGGGRCVEKLKFEYLNNYI